MSRWVSVALTIVGTVIGAGFASGQEIYQFFTRYGAGAGLGIALAMSLMVLAAGTALERGRCGETYLEYLRGVFGRWADLWDAFVAAFLTVSLGAVGAAAGSIGHTAVGGPAPLGAVLFLGAVGWWANAGAGAVLQAQRWVVPSLLTAVAVLTWASLRLPLTLPPPAPLLPWWVMALTYASYNLLTVFPLLFTLGATMTAPWQPWLAAFTAGGLLYLAAWGEHLVLLRLDQPADLPLWAVAHALNPAWGHLWMGVLLAALLTTALGVGLALRERWGPRHWVFWGLAAVLALWPLPTLVGGLYPLLGAASAGLWLPLWCRARR
ncbi:MAG: hypothetical protein K6U14_00665 [Firmicutes bacterium]|nr:hypothetical protein [Alicyclobacillaceae bacterium]MCL6496131.1 hypothetical protein [Bacillota bacterium]